MSTSTAAPKTSAHPDGGTVRILQSAPVTRDCWILLTEWITYRGQTRFEVRRYYKDGSVRIENPQTSEAKARELANAHWLRDRQAMRDSGQGALLVEVK